MRVPGCETAVTTRDFTNPSFEPLESAYDRALADDIDPIRVAERMKQAEASAAQLSCSAVNPLPLSAQDLKLVDEVMSTLTFVQSESDKLQMKNWFAQFLADDPRHGMAMYWPLPMMNLHAHVNGMLTGEKFLADVKESIKGHETEFWQSLKKSFDAFLKRLDQPLMGEEFQYNFDEHYREHLGHCAPQVPPEGASQEEIDRITESNLSELTKLMSVSASDGDDSCSVAYNHVYDFRGLVRDAVEAVTPDKGRSLMRATMLGIAQGLAKQRVGSVDLQVSRTFLSRPDSAELVAAANAHGIQINYLASELSQTRLTLGNFTEKDKDALVAALENPNCTGIDFCGAEFPFTPKGMKVFEEILLTMRDVSQRTGRVLTMRPHVGEGFKDRSGQNNSKEVGHRNIEMLLDTIEKIYREHGRLPLVEIRFGHATHTGADQAGRMETLGVVVESNPMSNEITGVAETRDQLGRLHFNNYGVRSLFGTDGEGVMGGDMHQVEQVEEAVLWAFRNGFATKDSILPGEKLKFEDLINHRADEIMYARLKAADLSSEDQEASDEDKAQAERELWNIYDMVRIKGLGENRRLQMGWMMRAAGEFAPAAERPKLLREAVEAAKNGEWDKLNHFLKCVFFFRGAQPRVQNPTGVPTAFSPTVPLSGHVESQIRQMIDARPAHKVEPFAAQPAPVKAAAPVKSDPKEVIEKLKSAYAQAAADIALIEVPKLEDLKPKSGEPSFAVEQAFVDATKGLTAMLTEILGKRIVVGPTRRACLDGWTLVLNDKKIVGVQLMPVNDKKTGKLSHYQHIGAGAPPVQLGDDAARFFTRTMPELLEQRGGAKNLLTGPNGKPLFYFGPADLTNDPKRTNLYVALATQSEEAEIGGKYTREGQEHEVLVHDEQGHVVLQRQERAPPTGWKTVTIEELRAFLKEKEPAGLMGHSVDLKYLLEQIDSLESPDFDLLVKKLRMGTLMKDAARDDNPVVRPLERVSFAGQKLLTEYFAKITEALRAHLAPLATEAKANFKPTRDFLEKGSGKEILGLADLVKKAMGGLDVNVSDAPFVRVQFKNGPAHWVGFGRSLLSYAPPQPEGKSWKIESISVDNTAHGLLLRYWDN